MNEIKWLQQKPTRGLQKPYLHNRKGGGGGGEDEKGGWKKGTNGKIDRTRAKILHNAKAYLKVLTAITQCNDWRGTHKVLIYSIVWFHMLAY